jgi:hypothetical protein
MKVNRFSLVLIALFLSVQIVQAQPKVLLRLNLQKGASYEQTMAMNNQIEQEMMGQKMNVDQKLEMAFLFQVLDVLPNNNFLIEYSVENVKMDMSMNGQNMSFNSESTDSINPMNAAFKGFIANKLKVELNPKGQVERVEGLEEYAKKLSANPQMAQTMQMFTDETSFKSFVGQSFSYFPENEVSKGDKWATSLKLPTLMNMETIMNFEVADITKDQVTLNVISDVNMDAPIEQMGMKMNIKATGTQNGNMIIDLTDGWLRTSDLNQKFNMKMNMKNPQSGVDMEIPMLMNSDVKFTVVKK